MLQALAHRAAAKAPPMLREQCTRAMMTAGSRYDHQMDMENFRIETADH
jgi:hypothetical protein